MAACRQSSNKLRAFCCQLGLGLGFSACCSAQEKLLFIVCFLLWVALGFLVSYGLSSASLQISCMDSAFAAHLVFVSFAATSALSFA